MKNQSNFPIQHIKTLKEFNDVFNYGFFEVYSDCFCDAPYFQQFSLERVWEDFSAMMLQGVFLCLRENNGRIGGFIAGSPLKNHSSIQETIINVTENSEHCLDWYHAEIGVSKRLRGNGFARLLWNEVLKLIPSEYTSIIARTHIHNNISLKMHKSFGFTYIHNSEHVISDSDYIKSDRDLEDDTRIFMCYNCK